MKIKEKVKNIYHFFENNYYVTSIKRGLSILLPVLVIGIIASIIRYFPISHYQNFMENTLNGAMGKFTEVFIDISLGYFSLFALISITYFVIKEKTKEFPVILMSIITSVICLFILTEVTFGKYDFGIRNIFLSLVLGCIVPTVIYKLMKKGKEFDPIYVKTNQQAYKDMIKLSFPVILLIGCAFLIRMFIFVVLKCDSVNAAIGLPFVKLINVMKIEILQGFFYQLFAQLFWFVGIDGNDALGSVNFCGNIINSNFMHIFVFSTAIFGLILALIFFSKNKKDKIYSRFGLIPAIFNQNKTIYLGLPIILRPILIIPFVISSLVIFLVSYLSVYLNMIPTTIDTVYNTLPVFFNGVTSTNSYVTLVVQFFSVALSFVIYIPFVRLNNTISEKEFNENIYRLLPEFEKSLALNPNSTIFTFNYALGELAKTMTFHLVEDMRKGNIETFFQPIVNSKKAYVGMECLMRWVYEGKVVPPPLALEIAKECGLFYDLNYYIWERMCKNVSTKKTKAFITFNVSVDCLEQDQFEDRLLALFTKYEIDITGFIIEITEETVLNHQYEILEKIKRLKEKGFQFAIDDYGAGQTSMKYFQTNAFGLVKIDGDLVKNAENNPQNYDIIKSMKDLGKKGKRFENINFKVLCEFIETEEQFETFNKLNVDYYQGYLFGKAMPYEEVTKLISVRIQQKI